MGSTVSIHSARPSDYLLNIAITKKRLTRITGSAVIDIGGVLFAGNLLVAVYSAIAKFLFDTEELGVFRHTV